MKHQSILVLFLILSCKIAFAQDSLQNSVYELPIGEVLKQEKKIQIESDIAVITTNRIGSQGSSKASANILIITAEQIRMRTYQSLLDVLQDLPSVKVDYGVDGRYMHNISMRGLVGMEKFVILLDGVRISSPTNEVIPIMENYPVHFAHQIEVVFGPASALYGADAYAGVINIITKNVEEIKRNELAVSTGMYKMYTANLLIGKRFNDKTSLILSGQYFFDQQPNLYKFYPNDYKNIEQTLSSGEFNTIFGKQKAPKIFPQPSQTPLLAYVFQASLKHQNFQFAFFSNTSENPTVMAQSPDNAVFNKGTFFGHSINMLNGTYTKKVGNWSFNSFLIASYYRLDPLSNLRNVFSGLEPAYKYSRGRMFKAEQLIGYHLSDKLNFVGGITVEDFFSIPRGHDLESPIFDKAPTDKGVIINSIYPNNPKGIVADFANVIYKNYGGFLQIQYLPTERLSFTFGSRYDYNTRYGSTFNPRLGIVYEVSKSLTTKLLYGSAFLAPSPLQAFEQFGSFTSFDDGTTYQSFFFRLPNPNLKPQLIDTFEGSFNYSKNQLRINLTGFYSISSGLFSYGLDKDNQNLYKGTYKGWKVETIETAINSGKQTFYGGHLIVDYRKIFSDKNSINIYTSMSYVDGKVNNIENQSTNTDKEIPAITPFVYRFGIDWVLKKFTFSSRLTYVGTQNTYNQSISNPEKRQKIAGYPLVNLNAQYRFNNYFAVFTQIRNLLDIRYYNVNLGASPERVGTGGAAQAEIAAGAPQNPFRIIGGVRVSF